MSASTQSLRSLVFASYRRASISKSIKFAQTEPYSVVHEGINYQVRYAPNLLKKPISALQPANPATSTPPNPIAKTNPFLPPDPALYITAIPRNHYLLLNKFPVIPGHFILVTNDFEQQECPLSVADMEGVLGVLRGWEHDTVDKDSATAIADKVIDAEVDDKVSEEEARDQETAEAARTYTSLYGFFNSGKESGASQPHRHIQFCPLSQVDMQTLWSEQMFASSGELAEGVIERQVGETKVRFQSKMQFKHYFVAIPPDCTPEQLWTLYTLLLSLAEYTLFHPTTLAEDILKEVDEKWEVLSLTQRAMDEHISFSYNLAFSKGWIGVVPRTTETVYVVDKDEDSGVEVDDGKGGTIAIKCPGLNLNGTVGAGMMLVRTRKELDVVMGDLGCIARTIGGIGVSQGDGGRARL